MKTVTNLFNLPDALEWVHQRREIFSVLSGIANSVTGNHMAVLVPIRVRS